MNNDIINRKLEEAKQKIAEMQKGVNIIPREVRETVNAVPAGVPEVGEDVNKIEPSIPGIIKAMSDSDINAMLQQVNADEVIISDPKAWFDKLVTPSPRIKVPSRYQKAWENNTSKLDEKYPLEEVPKKGAYHTEGQTEVREKNEEIKSKRLELYKGQLEHLVSIINDHYPNKENLESKLLLEYIERNHGGNVKEIKADIKAYEKRKGIKLEEGKAKWATEQEDKKKKDALINEKVQEKLADWKEQLAVQGEKDIKNLPKSTKLVNEWIGDVQGKDIGSYRTFLQLIDLVGKLSGTDENSILRLEKYVKEHKDNISVEDITSINAILIQLKDEQKTWQKKQGRELKVTPSAIDAKSSGLTVGKDSKFRKNKKSTSLRINYADDYITLTGKQGDLFSSFEKIDLKNNIWFNDNTLKEITEYWIEKAGYTEGIDKWEAEPEDSKVKYIKVVLDILPKYPSVNNNMKVPLARLYNNVWEEYKSGNTTDPEDFAYFTQGIQAGLTGLIDNMAEDFNKLKEFRDTILPQLIRAVKQGIVVDIKEDGTREIRYRLGPVLSKVMKKLGGPPVREKIISDFIAIITGQGLSNKYAGRNKAELKSIEDSVIDLVKPIIHKHSIASYIISTFMRTEKTSSMLRQIFNNPKNVVEIEYLKPQKQPSKDKDKPKEKRNIVESDLIEMNRQIKDSNRLPTKEKDESGKWKNIGYKEGWERQLIDIDGWKKDGRAITVSQRNKDAIPKVKPQKPRSGFEHLDEKGPKSPFSNKKYGKSLKDTKKSLDNLLVVMGEEDNIMLKEDVGIILESLNKKQRKKVKAILNIADPTEYFGHDFLKLADLVKVLKSLGVVKGDKKLNKKILNLEDENLKVVKLATRLRKDYENLYRDLREMIYPKSGE